MECSLAPGGGPRTETGYTGEIAALLAGLGAPQCGRGVRSGLRLLLLQLQPKSVAENEWMKIFI